MSDYERRSDGVYAFNPQTETYYKISDDPFFDPNRSTKDYEKEYRLDKAARDWEKRKEAAITRKAREHEEFERERKKYWEEKERKERERYAEVKAKTERRKALEEAYERYKKLGKLYRLMHKSFSVSTEGKTTEELNSMYTGRKK